MLLLPPTVVTAGASQKLTHGEAEGIWGCILGRNQACEGPCGTKNCVMELEIVGKLEVLEPSETRWQV